MICGKNRDLVPTMGHLGQVVHTSNLPEQNLPLEMSKNLIKRHKPPNGTVILDGMSLKHTYMLSLLMILL